MSDQHPFDEHSLDPPRWVDDATAAPALRQLLGDGALVPPPLPSDVYERARPAVRSNRSRNARLIAGVSAALAMAAVVVFAVRRSPTLVERDSIVSEPGGTDASFIHASRLDAGIPSDAALDTVAPISSDKIPWIDLSPGEGCSIDYALYLPRRPREDFVGLRVLLRAVAAEESFATRCAGTVVLESGRAIQEVEGVEATVALVGSVEPPLTRCGDTYELSVCAVDREGRVYADPGRSPQRLEMRLNGSADITTPSGRRPAANVQPGEVVTSVMWATRDRYRPQDGHRAPPTLVRGLVRSRGRESRSDQLDVTLEDGHVAHLPLDVNVWRPELERFERARELVAGSRVLGEDLAALEVRSVVPSDAHETFPELDVDQDSYFVGGILVEDARRSPNGAPVIEIDHRVTESVALRPELAYDCVVRVEVDILDESALARSATVAVALRRSIVPRGATSEPACLESNVVADVPTALLAARPRVHGEPVGVLLEFRGWDSEGSDWHGLERGLRPPRRPRVECDRDYDVVACARLPDGTLAPWPNGIARSALAGPACFAGDTPIATPNGAVAIETIGPGDEVLTLDERGSLARVRVRALIPRGARETLHMELSSGSHLDVTEEHPLFDPRTGEFRPAGELRPGDSLLGVSGEHVVITSIEQRIVRVAVYDLSVDAPHTFFASGILAHNY